MEHNYLVHHGILGQRKGKRNGPPYPLKAGQHSAAERKAGKSGWTSQARSMSDEELRKAVNRKRLENDYYRIHANSGANKNAKEALNVVSKGFRTAGKAASTAGEVAKLNKDNKSSEKLRQKANKANKKADTIANQKIEVEKPEDITNLTDSELRKKVDRMSLEMQYDDLYGSSSKGMKEVANCLDAAGDALVIGKTALEIAGVIVSAKLSKKLYTSAVLRKAAKAAVPVI